ncbi:hypothetical protein AHAS_Ahas11G0108000 [Arachis hypogaea]
MNPNATSNYSYRNRIELAGWTGNRSEEGKRVSLSLSLTYNPWLRCLVSPAPLRLRRCVDASVIGSPALRRRVSVRPSLLSSRPRPAWLAVAAASPLASYCFAVTAWFLSSLPRSATRCISYQGILDCSIFVVR